MLCIGTDSATRANQGKARRRLTVTYSPDQSACAPLAGGEAGDTSSEKPCCTVRALLRWSSPESSLPCLVAQHRLGRFSQDRQMAIEAEDAEWQRMRQRRLSPTPPDPDEKEEVVQQSGWMRVASAVKETSTHRRASTTALGTRTPISTGFPLTLPPKRACFSPLLSIAHADTTWPDASARPMSAACKKRARSLARSMDPSTLAVCKYL